jgi:hypothetical protein
MRCDCAGVLFPSFAALQYFSLAATDTQVFAWGGNAQCQLGRECMCSDSAGLPSVSSAALQYFSLAATDTQVFAWGSNAQSQLGTGKATTSDCAGLPVSSFAALQYFSLAATDTRVFAWGSNAQSQLGTGNSSIIELLQPTAVAGPLSSGEWQIRGLAAGYQHAFAIADKPGDAELQRLRQEGRAAAGMVGGSTDGVAGALQLGVRAPGVAGIEVVLTEKQRQDREQQQRQQQQQQQGGDAAPPASPTDNSSSSSSDAVAPATLSTQTGAAAAVNTANLAGRDVAAAVPTTQHLSQQPSASHHAAATSSSSSSACSTLDKLPADWHTSYLPTQGPNLPLPRDVWASWRPSPWHNHLAGLSPDVFELLPERYNAEHKNSCWGGLGPDLSCLPYFNIIGVSKCGTTDLYHRLTLHKQILAATNKVR